jgi:hypothetical protein
MDMRMMISPSLFLPTTITTYLESGGRKYLNQMTQVNQIKFNHSPV